MIKGEAMGEVAPGVWVGSEEAAHKEELLRGRVKHVLVIGSGAHHTAEIHSYSIEGLKPAFPASFEYRVHAVLDLDTEDLVRSLSSNAPHSQQLSHFDDLVSWVATRQSGGVLIHCAHGVSRSVYAFLCTPQACAAADACSTVATAFIMKTLQLDASSALARIKATYPPASPNEGFRQQLELYGEMGARVDRQHRAFRAYLLNRQADLVTAAASSDASLSALHTDAEGQLGAGMAVYACRACRKRLFLSDAVVAHEKGKAQFERKHGQYRTAQEDCTSYFIETYTWMGDLSTIEGKLCCPKCSARVGSYNWAGMQCSCGTWVRPAFQIVKSKVDEVGLVNVPPATQKR